MNKFKTRHFSLFMSLGISRCRRTPFGIIFKCKYRPGKKIERIFVFAFMHPLSFRGYFFVLGPLGDLKLFLGDVFGATDLIGSFLKNICFLSKNRLFAKRWDSGVGPKVAKFEQIFKSAFYTPLCP